MGVITAFRDRRHDLTRKESIDTLSYMEDFFQNGANWTQGVYHAANGSKCLVAAADHVRVTPIDDAKHWLRVAIAERAGPMSIEQFNDSSPSFEQVAAVIARAKQLAATGGRALPQPDPVGFLTGEILPPLAFEDRQVPAVVAPMAKASKPSLISAARRSLDYFRD
jgi:hypothetical protein